MRGQRVTRRQYNGKGESDWAVFIGDRPVLTGLTKPVAAYEANRQRRFLKERDRHGIAETRS